MLNLEKDEYRLWELAAAFAAANHTADAACLRADDLVLAFRARRQHSTGHAGPPPVAKPAAPPAAPPSSTPPAAPPGWKAPPVVEPPMKAAPLPGSKPPLSARKQKPVEDMSINEKLAELERLQTKFSEAPGSLGQEEMANMVALTGDETLRRITVNPGSGNG